MKYIFTFSFLLISFLTFSQTEYTVNTELLNVRSGAGTEYEVVGQVKLNQKVLEISKSGNWSEIKTDDFQGFVSSKYINKVNNNSNKEDDNSIVSWLIGLGILGYILIKVKNFFSGLFGGSSTSSRSVKRKPSSSPKKNTAEKTVSLIADTRVKSNNYIETFDEKGKRINGMFLGSNERFVGFSQYCFITVKSNNYLTTHNAQCKRINGMFLGSNENFHGVAGNTFTTKKDNNYVTTYDTNCKRVSGRFA